MHKTVTLGWQIVTVKTTTIWIRTLYVHVVLNDVIFRQILYDIFPDARHFFYLSRFFPKEYFNNLCSQLPQNVTRTQWRITHCSITPLKRAWWPIIFIVFFSKQCLAGDIQGKFQKQFSGNFYFWGITLIYSWRRQTLRSFCAFWSGIISDHF